jgi:hypothetical protein
MPAASGENAVSERNLPHRNRKSADHKAPIGKLIERA